MTDRTRKARGKFVFVFVQTDMYRTRVQSSAASEVGPVVVLVARVVEVRSR